MKKKYYILYKTTNLKNNKFYIGVHETNNLNDGYLGSGKKFKNSLYYHGKENFKREILEYFNSSTEMYEREAEIVNEELLKNPKCLNIGLGGIGGFSNNIHKHNFLLASKQTRFTKNNNPSFNIENKKNKSIIFKRLHKQGKIKYDTFTGKKHSEETKLKMSESKIGKCMGKNNSQFGTCWITNEKINKKIYRGDEIPKGFRLGRKIK